VSVEAAFLARGLGLVSAAVAMSVFLACNVVRALRRPR
jgi:hypothetical protein